MGASGSGKTTLLNVLANRVQGKVEGTILYNGHPAGKAKAIGRELGYVMQDDILIKVIVSELVNIY